MGSKRIKWNWIGVHAAVLMMSSRQKQSQAATIQAERTFLTVLVTFSNRFRAWLQIILAEANTFLENNKIITIIFNYIFGLMYDVSKNPLFEMN